MMSDQFHELNDFGESPYLTPIHKTLVVDEIIDRLIALVINEHLKPGDKLPTERELMNRLSIGRSSLREAIKTLSAVGALEVKRGSGIYVGTGDTSILARPLAWSMFLNQNNVGQVIEARSVIEAALAGWAAERRSNEDLTILIDLFDKLEISQNDKEAYIDTDLKFHLAIGKAAQNDILFQVLTIFQHLLKAWMEITYHETQGASDSMKTHRELIEAIRRKDAESARRLMQNHTSGAPLRSAMARKETESQMEADFLSLIKDITF